MRRLLVATLAIVFTMTLAALAQKPPEAGPGKKIVDGKIVDDKAVAEKVATDSSKALEELLTQALQNSPDVQVAEARLKEAEAALRQARLAVTQKAVDLQLAKDQKQLGLSHLETEFRRLSQLRNAGTVSAGELSKLESELAQQKAQIAQVEAQVNMLTGKLPGGGDAAQNQGLPVLFQRFRGNVNVDFGGGAGGGTGEVPAKRQPPTQMSGKLRTILSSPIKVPDTTNNGLPMGDVIAHIRETTGAPILSKGVNDEKAVLDFKGEITLAAYFQMLCDSVPNLAVYVRDYGFLVTNDVPPDDAISVMDFWRGGEKSK